MKEEEEEFLLKDQLNSILLDMSHMLLMSTLELTEFLITIISAEFTEDEL